MFQSIYQKIERSFIFGKITKFKYFDIITFYEKKNEFGLIREI